MSTERPAQGSWPPRAAFAAGLMILSLALPSPRLAFAAPGTPAGAPESDKERAREHFRRGERLYNVSDYAAALGEFKAGYLLHDDPVFLFNIAQCHRMLGARDEAITFYERFLRASPEAPNRAEVERRVAQLRTERDAAAAGAGTATSPSASASVGAERAAVPMTSGPVAVPPGAPGVPEVGVASAGAADAGTPVYARWWFWTVLGAAVAGTVAVIALTAGPGGPDCAGVSPCYTVDPRR